MIERVDFETAWSRCVRQLRAVAFRALRDPALADDVVQQVAIRGLRGFARFQWSCPVIVWFMQLLKWEIGRAYAKVGAERVRNEPLDAVSTEPAASTSPPSDDDDTASALRAAIDAATSDGAISQQEGQMLVARLHHPDASWPELGRMLGMNAATCASTHCRAIPRFRTYLFIHHAAVLGGAHAIRRAFDDALRTNGRLTAEEAETFRRIVLEGAPIRGAGVRSLLRSACATVALFLSRSGARS